MLVQGHVIRNEKGDDLAQTGFWYAHDDASAPFVHPSQVLETIRNGGATGWESEPAFSIEARFDSTKPGGEKVQLLGEPERIQVDPYGKESYVEAVVRLAEFLRGGQR